MGKRLIVLGFFVYLFAVYSYLNADPDLNDPKSFDVFTMDIGNRRKTLTVAEQRLDVQFLIQGFRKSYAGQKVKSQEVEAYLKSLGDTASRFERDMETEEFHSWLHDSMYSIRDGHLGVGNWYENPTRWRREDNVLRAPTSVSQNSVEVFEAKGKKFAICKIKTFLEEPLFEDRKMFRELESHIKTMDAIIFDLRGNQGGYLQHNQPLAAILWGKTYRADRVFQDYPSPILEIGAFENDWTRAMMRNRAVNDKTEFGALLLTEFRKSWYEKLFQDSKLGPDPVEDLSFAERNPVVDGTEDLETKGFNKPIYLITDEACASACEIFLEDLEAHPKAITIGSNTQGAAQFGSVATLVLPKSHLVVSIPTRYVVYKDGRELENFGYAPEIPLKAGEDPIAYAKKLIFKK